MIQKLGPPPAYGTVLESILVEKILLDREYQYYAPLVASGAVDMKKAIEALKNTVFRDTAQESKKIFSKMAKVMKEIKKFKFFGRFKNE